MNKIIFIFIFLTTTLSFACPNLSGKYSCKNSANETFALTITQSVKDGIHTYIYDYKYQNMIPYFAQADGIYTDIINSEFQGKEKYECVDKSVVHTRIGEHYDQGTAYAHSELIIKDFLDNKGDLTTLTHLKLRNYDQEKPSEINITENCKRKN